MDNRACNSKPDNETDEVFTESQIDIAIQQWLNYGEQSYAAMDVDRHNGHGGYFSGYGWAARCLRYHLNQRLSRSEQSAETSNQ